MADGYSLTPRQRSLKRWEALKNERSSWLELWRDCSDHILPRRFRHLGSDTNRGDRADSYIINNTPTRALRTLGSGIMSGASSPARPWFRLTTPDPDLADFGPVKAWLHDCVQRMNTVFARSNVYQGLYQVYRGLGWAGLTPLFIDEDADDVVRAYVFPVGSFCLANSARLAVDTLYREVRMPAGAVMRKFEKGNGRITEQTKRLARENPDAWVDIIHLIEPREGYDASRAGPANMPWKSCWLELGASESDHPYLLESGYEEFPAMCPRWDTVGQDVYASGFPGEEALGDAKALQQYEKRKALAIEMVVRPPMTGPAAMRNVQHSLLPASFTPSPAGAPGAKYEPAHVPNHGAIEATSRAIFEHERRIESAFYADLWLMLQQRDANGDPTQMTAREVAERHEEKMVQLGPVVDRLQDELYDPLIDRVFAIMLRNGMLPEPPEELDGVDLRVEHISVLAQAQKLLGTSSIERLVGFAAETAKTTGQTDVLDKINLDKAIDNYGDMLGVDPEIIRSDEQVAELRGARAEAQKAQEGLAAGEQMAKTAQSLSGADLEGDNALRRLLQNLGPAAAGALSGGGVQ